MIAMNLSKGPVNIGCGYLYAMPVADFKVGETTYETMTEVGYISEDGATFKRSAESNPIVTANYGTVGYYNSAYETEFTAGVISLNKDNMTIFSTGSSVEEIKADGSNTVTGYRMYGREDDKPAEVALCFRCMDAGKGKYFNLYMPNATWIPELEWTFDAENPLMLNMNYKCSNTTFPDESQGSYYIDTNLWVA